MPLCTAASTIRKYRIRAVHVYRGIVSSKTWNSISGNTGAMLRKSLIRRYNSGHNILELSNNLVYLPFATSKRKLGTKYGKLVINASSRVA